MSLTAHDAIRHIEHTLASDSVPEVGAMRILNDAGQFLVNMHNWRWLESQQATLDLAKDTNYVWLPDNFRELVAIETEDGLNAGVMMTTQEQLLRLRSAAVANSSVYRAAVVHAERRVAASALLHCNSLPVENNTFKLDDGVNPEVTFVFVDAAGTHAETATAREVVLGATTALTAVSITNAINAAPATNFTAEDNNPTTPDSKVKVTYAIPGVGGNLGAEANWFTDTNNKFAAATAMAGGVSSGPPRPRLDIWPTPTADDVGGILVYYRAGWATVDDGSHILYLPEWVETLYLFLVRTFARAYEREGDVHISTLLDAIVQSPLYLSVQQRDKEMTPSFGAMTGGAVQSMGGQYDNLWNFSSTSGPN